MHKRSLRLVRHHLINISASIIWAYFAYINIKQLAKSPSFGLEALPYLAWFLRNSSVTLLFLTRRVVKTSSRKVHEWITAVVGTFIGLLYQPDASSLIHFNHQGIIYFVMALASVLTVVAILSLGRSFGIVPANRGVQTGGLYSIVRHPVYGCYIFFDLTFIILKLSWFNMLVFCTSCLALYLRAQYEESFLRTDQNYRDYAKRIGYMFFPKVL